MLGFNLYRFFQTVRGKPILKVVDALKKSQWFSQDELKQRQWHDLKRLLAHAWQTVPFYRNLFDQLGITPEEIRTESDFRKIPILTRQQLVDHQHELHSVAPQSRTSIVKTGGSTGKPVSLKVDSVAEAYYPANIYRTLSWYGIDIGEPWATIWGRLLEKNNTGLSVFKDFLANKIRLSTRDIDEQAEAFFFKIKKHKARYIYGYASSVLHFAHRISQKQLDPNDLNLKAVVCTSDNLNPSDRQFLKKMFGCAIVDIYGATEIGVVGAECPDHSLHIPVESVYLELEEEETKSSFKNVLVTDLHNTAMPIIRYRIGDIASGIAHNCGCGLGLPVLTSMPGRSFDLITTPTGEKIHPMIFNDIIWQLPEQGANVGQFQFVRKSANKMNCYLFGSSLQEREIDFLKEKLEEQLRSEILVDIVISDQRILRPSGKQAYYVSEWSGDR
jgi:phenylacetate-CoA ligase